MRWLSTVGYDLIQKHNRESVDTYLEAREMHTTTSTASYSKILADESMPFESSNGEIKQDGIGHKLQAILPHKGWKDAIDRYRYRMGYRVDTWKWQKLWAVVKEGYVAFYTSRCSTTPLTVLLLDKKNMKLNFDDNNNNDNNSQKKKSIINESTSRDKLNSFFKFQENCSS